jgi:hypothetical protein
VWRSKAKRTRSDELLDLARRLELAAEEIDGVIAAAHKAEEQIRARERSAGASLADGRPASVPSRIGAETVNTALERVVRIAGEAESVSTTLKRAAAALSGRMTRTGTLSNYDASQGEGLSLRPMSASHEQGLDRAR